MKLANFVVFCMLVTMFPMAQSAEVESQYNPATGVVTLPHLKIGTKTYYVELKLTDASKLTFQVDTLALKNVTPAPNYVDPGKNAVVGSWGDTEQNVFILNNDGTYSFSLTVARFDCPAGMETGTYKWESTTGIFTWIIGEDHNGQCGLGGGGHVTAGPVQLFVEGNTLTQMGSYGGEVDSGTFTRK